MWIYKEKQIKSLTDFPKNIIGFVYEIVDENGKKYIGRKSIFSRRKRKFGKKEIAKLNDKRKKHYEIVVKENNWLTYTGSCKPLNTEIKKGLKITKNILHICFTKKQLTYYETKEQVCQGVIENNEHFWNDNILGKFFPSDFEDKK